MGIRGPMDRIALKVGEERAVHLPPGRWTVRIAGMVSAVSVTKLWPADPYPEDDEDDEDQAQKPPPDVVLIVRGMAPGTATLRFGSEGTAGAEASREVGVEVSL
jgi:hypothetical protein